MKKNPNTNCLDGMQCPACGDFGPFRIEVSAVITVYDSGTSDTETDEWDDNSRCACVACCHEGTVATFSATAEDQALASEEPQATRFKFFTSEEAVLDYVMDEIVDTLQDDADRSDEEDAEELHNKIHDIQLLESAVQALPKMLAALKAAESALAEAHANIGEDESAYSDALQQVRAAIAAAE